MNSASKPRALVVAAHSDDEALGCGGTIARLSALGWDVGIVFMTNGVGSRLNAPQWDPAAKTREAHKRHEASLLAIKTLGARHIQTFDFQDNAMDGAPLLSVAQAIEGVALEFSPQLVFTHHNRDLNVDHRVTHQATLTAFRPLPGSQVQAILCFEVPSSTGWNSASETPFHPTLSVDISGSFTTKLEALRHYEIEMRPPPHPRSIPSVESLARWRGSASGVEVAEAFEIQRIVLRGGAPNFMF